MQIFKKFYFLFRIIIICLLVITCGSKIKQNKDQKYYLAHNLWYETNKVRPSGFSLRYMTIAAINYKTGRIISAGNIVKDITVYDNKIDFFIPSIEIMMTLKINKTFDPDLNGQKLFKRTITEQPFEKLIEDFTTLEIEAIKSGILVSGMTKKAVIVSFGYPPEHQTSDMNLDVWYYWRNKWGKLVVEFDDNDKVKNDVIPPSN